MPEENLLNQLNATQMPAKVPDYGMSQGVNESAALEQLNQQAARTSNFSSAPKESQYDVGRPLGTDPDFWRAESQSKGAQFANMLGQLAIGEIVGGSIEGAGYLLDIKSAFDHLGESDDAFHGFLQDLGSGIRDRMKENAPVYRDPADLGKFQPYSWSWWMDNAPTIGSSIALMLPAMGVTKALGYGVSKLPALSKLAKGMSSTQKWLTTAVAQATISRHAESMMEAKQTYDDEYQNAIKAGKNPEEANIMASKAAANNYRANWWMIGQDIAQYALLGRAFGKAASDNTLKVATRMGKSAMPVIGKKAAAITWDLGMEAGEEAYQFITNEESKYLVDRQYGITNEKPFSDRLIGYLEDGDFWTSAFMGALGAGAMQISGRGLQMFGKKDRDGADLKLDDINSWGAAYSKSTKKLAEAMKTGDGELVNTLMNDAVVDLGLKSARIGNIQNHIDMLESMAKDPSEEIKRRFGLNEMSDEEFEQFRGRIPEMVTTLKRVEDVWNKTNQEFKKNGLELQFVAPTVQRLMNVELMQKSIPVYRTKAENLRKELYGVEKLSPTGRAIFDKSVELQGLANALVIYKTRLGKLAESKDPVDDYYLKSIKAAIKTQEEKIAAINEDIKKLTIDKAYQPADRVTDRDIINKTSLTQKYTEMIAAEAIANTMETAVSRNLEEIGNYKDKKWQQERLAQVAQEKAAEKAAEKSERQTKEPKVPQPVKEEVTDAKTGKKKVIIGDASEIGPQSPITVHVGKRKGNLEAGIKEAQENAGFIRLSGKKKEFYLDMRDNGKVGSDAMFQRVTHYIKEKPEETPELLASEKFGNAIDKLSRDIMGGTFKESSKPEDYLISDAESFKALVKELKKLKSQIEKRGEKIIASGMTLYSEELRLAGTVDILTYNPKTGDVTIYDVKSMKRFDDYYSKLYGMSKAEQHSAQLNLYRILLANTHGIVANKLGVIPVVLAYRVDDETVSSAQMQEVIDVPISNTVKDVTLNTDIKKAGTKAVEKKAPEPKAKTTKKVADTEKKKKPKKEADQAPTGEIGYIPSVDLEDSYEAGTDEINEAVAEEALNIVQRYTDMDGVIDEDALLGDWGPFIEDLKDMDEVDPKERQRIVQALETDFGQFTAILAYYRLVSPDGISKGHKAIKEAIQDNWKRLSTITSIRAIKNKNNRRSYEDILEFNAAERFTPVGTDVEDLTQLDELGIASTESLRAESDKGIITQNKDYKLRQVVDPVTKTKVWVSELDENLELIDEKDTLDPEDTMAQIDHELLNDPTVDLRGEIAHLEIMEEDPWNKSVRNTKDNGQTQIAVVIYLDGNQDNMDPVNRKIVGIMPAAANINKPVFKKLNALRKAALESPNATTVKDHRGKTVTRTGIATVISNKTPGRIMRGQLKSDWEYLIPVDENGRQKFYLAVVQTEGSSTVRKLYAPNVPMDITESITHNTNFLDHSTPGAVYLLVPTANPGEWMPVRMFTKSIDEFPNRKAQVVQLLSTITEDNFEKVVAEVRNTCYMDLRLEGDHIIVYDTSDHYTQADVAALGKLANGKDKAKVGGNKKIGIYYYGKPGKSFFTEGKNTVNIFDWMRENGVKESPASAFWTQMLTGRPMQIDKRRINNIPSRTAKDKTTYNQTILEEELLATDLELYPAGGQQMYTHSAQAVLSGEIVDPKATKPKAKTVQKIKKGPSTTSRRANAVKASTQAKTSNKAPSILQDKTDDVNSAAGAKSYVADNNLKGRHLNNSGHDAETKANFLQSLEEDETPVKKAPAAKPAKKTIAPVSTEGITLATALSEKRKYDAILASKGDHAAVLEKLGWTEDYYNKVADKAEEIPFRLATDESGYPVVTDEEITWFKENLPQVPLEIIPYVSHIMYNGGPKAWGTFVNNSAIVAQLGAEGTVYHEAWHVVQELFLSDKENSAVFKEAEERYGTKDIKQLKEYLAEDFREYAQTEGQTTKTWGESIRNFFKKLWIAVKMAVRSPLNINQYFFAVHRGMYKNKSPRISSKFRSTEPLYRVSELTPTEEQDTIRSLNYYFFKEIQSQLEQQGNLNPVPDDYRDYILEKHPFTIYKTVVDKYIVPLMNTAEAFIEQKKAEGKPHEKALAKYNKLSAVVANMFPNNRLGFGPLAVSCVNDLTKYGFRINLGNINLAVDYVDDFATDDNTASESTLDMDEAARNESWQAEVGSRSMRETMSLRIKMVINALPAEGTNWFGGVKFLDGSEAYNQLLAALSDIFDPQQMMDALEQFVMTHSAFAPLLIKMATDPQFKAEFFTNFANTHAQFMFMDIESYGDMGVKVKIYAANRRGLNMMLMERWKTDMFNENLSAVLLPNGEINSTLMKITLQQNKAISRSVMRVRKNMTIAQAVQNATAWVEAVAKPLGLQVDVDVMTSVFLNTGDKDMRKFFTNMDKIISKLAGTDREPSKSPFGTYTDATGEVHGSDDDAEISAVLLTTAIISKNSKQLFEDGFRNAENKQVYAHRVPNNVAKFISALNGTEEEVQAFLNRMYMNDPFFAGWEADFGNGVTEAIGRNDILYKLMNDPEFRAGFVTTLIDGIKRGDDRGVKYTKMSDNDLFTVAINMFLNPNGAEGTAWIKVPTLSDKPSMMFVMTDMDNMIDPTTNEFSTAGMMAKLENMVMQETIRNQRLLDRRAQFESGELSITEFISGYDLENSVINAYKERLKQEGKEDAANDIKTRDGIDYVYFRSAPGVVIEAPEGRTSKLPLMDNLLDEIKMLMEESKYKNMAMDEFVFALIKDELEPELHDELMTWLEQFMDANYNSFFQGLLETGIIEEAVTKEGQKYYTSTNINLGSFVSPEDKPKPGKRLLPKRFRSMEHALQAYYWNSFVYGGQISQLFSADKWFYVNDEAFQKRNMQIGSPGWMIDHTATYTLTEEETQAEAEARGVEVNGPVTLGVGETFNYVYALDEYVAATEEFLQAMRDILMEEGWSKINIERHMKGFEAMIHTDGQSWVTLDRHRRVEIGLGRWNAKKQATFVRGLAGDISANDLEIFMTRKPFYYSLHQIGDITVPTQIKNAETVLVPQVAYKTDAVGNLRYPKLARMLDFMTKKGEFANREGDELDAVHTMSASKVGALLPIDLETVSGDFTSDYIHVGNNRDYRHQQETPEHFVDEDIVSGTQIRKLAIANLLQEFGNEIMVADTPMKVEELVSKYQALITADIMDAYNLTMGRMESLEDVQAILMEQLVKNEMDVDFASALQLRKLEDGRSVFNIPLFHPFHAYRIESMLNSIFKNSVVRQRQNGASLVQISSFGFHQDLNIVFNEDNTIKYFECYMPWWMEDYMPINEEGEVDIHKLEQMDPEILEMVGYRIPTEGKYSMMKMKVKGFLPRFAGGTIALPAAMSKLTGADFDIDKLYVFLPNILLKTDGTAETVKYNNGTTTADERYRYLMKEQEIAGTREGRVAIAKYMRKHAAEVGIQASSRGRQAQIEEIKLFIQIVNDFKDQVVSKLEDLKAQESEQSKAYKEAKRQLNIFLQWAEPRLAELNELLAPLVEENDEMLADQQAHWEQGDYRRTMHIKALRQPLVDAIAPLKAEKFDIINEIRALRRAFPIDRHLTRPTERTSADIMPGEETGTGTAFGEPMDTIITRNRQNPRLGIDYLIAEITDFNDGIKALKDEMNNIFMLVSIMRQQALIDAGLLQRPEDFAKKEGGEYVTSLDIQNTKWARENERLRLIKAVLSSPLGTAETLGSGGFDNWKEDTSKYILGLKGQSKTKLNITLPQHDLLFTSRNLAGRELVGIMANANVNHAILQYGNVAIRDDKMAVEFNGKAGRSLSQVSFEAYDPATGTTRKIYISKSLGTMVAMVVDNAKTPVAPFINLNTYTADLYTFILRAGHSETTAALFMTQPIIELATREYFKNKRGFRLDKFEREMTKLIRGKKWLDIKDDEDWKKVNDDIEKAHMPKRAKTDPEFGRMNYNLTDEEMANNIKFAAQMNVNMFSKPIEDLIDEDEQYRNFLLNQLRILRKFMELKEGAEVLTDVIQGMRIDSVGPGPLITNNDEMIDRVMRIQDPESNISQWFSGLAEFFDPVSSPYPMLYAFTQFGLIKPTEHMTKLHPMGPGSITVMFPWHSPLFAQVNDFIVRNAAWKSAVTPEYKQYINYELLNYLMTEFSPLNFSSERREELIYDTPNELETLKAEMPEFAKEPFIARLVIVKDKAMGIKKIRFDNTNPKTKAEEANIRQNWQMLMESEDPRIRNLAFKLASYAALGGIAFGPNTFLSYLPINYYYTQLKNEDGMSLADFLEREVTGWMAETHNSRGIAEGFVMSFLRNNYNREGIIREVGMQTFMVGNRKVKELNVNVLKKGKDGRLLEFTPIMAGNLTQDRMYMTRFAGDFLLDAKAGIYAPIVKQKVYDPITQEWDVRLYELDPTMPEPTYRLTHKLGIPNFIKEYDATLGDNIQSVIYTNQVEYGTIDEAYTDKPVGYKSNTLGKPTRSAEPLNVWYAADENADLSNLALRPFTYQGKQYISVEHAYQTNKSGTFDKTTYGAYKKAGVKIKGKRPALTEEDWNIRLMKELMYESFKQNPSSAETLLETGDAPFTHEQATDIWKDTFPALLEEVRGKLREELGEPGVGDATNDHTPRKQKRIQPSRLNIKPVTGETERKRNYSNVMSSDGVLVLASAESRMVKDLNELSSKEDKPFLAFSIAEDLKVTNKLVDSVVKWMNEHSVHKIYISGDNSHQSPYEDEYLREFMHDLLSQVLSHPDLKVTLTGIKNGGESGIEEATVFAAQALGLKGIEIRPTADFKYTNENGKFEKHTEKTFKERYASNPLHDTEEAEEEIEEDVAEETEKTKKLARVAKALIVLDSNKRNTKGKKQTFKPLYKHDAYTTVWEDDFEDHKADWVEANTKFEAYEDGEIIGFSTNVKDESSKEFLESRLTKPGTILLLRAGREDTAAQLPLLVKKVIPFDLGKMTAEELSQWAKNEGVTEGWARRLSRKADKREGVQFIVEPIDPKDAEPHEGGKDGKWFQLENESREPVNKALNNKLKAFLGSNGINVEAAETLMERYGRDAVAVSDFMERLVLVAEGKADKLTLPEEAAHFALAGLKKDDPRLKTILESVEDTDEYAKVAAQYGDVYENNPESLRKEAAGKILAKYIVQEHEAPASIPLKVIRAMRAIWNGIMGLLRRAKHENFVRTVDEAYKSVAREVLSGTMKLDQDQLDSEGRVYFDLPEIKSDPGKPQATRGELQKLQKLLEKSIRAKQKGLKIMESQGGVSTWRTGTGKSYSEIEKTEIKQLQKLLDQSRVSEGISRYVQYLAMDLFGETVMSKGKKQAIQMKGGMVSKLHAMKTAFQAQGVQLENANANAKTLKLIFDYATSHKQILGEIRKELMSSSSGGYNTESEDIKMLSYVETYLQQIEDLYYELSSELFASVLAQYMGERNTKGVEGGLAPLNIKEVLLEAVKDISFAQLHLDALAEANDDILGMIAKMVTQAKLSAQAKAVEIRKEIQRTHEKLEAAGYKDTMWAYEHDDEGNITGNLLTEYRIADYKAARTAMFNSLAVPKREDFNTDKEYYAAVKIRNKKISTWIRENTTVVANWEDIVQQHKEKLTKSAFEAWKERHLQKDWGDEGNLIPKAFSTILSRPADKYKNPAYEKLTAPQREYLDTMRRIKSEVDMLINPRFVDGYRAPQIRKDVLETFKDTNGLGEKFKKVGKRLAEGVVRTEKDVEFGDQAQDKLILTDTRGRVVNFLPLYFIHPLKDMTDLSTDLSTTMAAYATMALDYGEMSQIINILEVGKDIIVDRRKVSMTDSAGKQIKQALGIGQKRETVHKEQGSANSVRRLLAFYDMVVYGHVHADEGSFVIGKHRIDKAKVMDAIGKYVAINGLALNLYAGIANVAVGTIQERIEAIAKRHFDSKDLLYADLSYTKLLPGVMGSIGLRNPIDKLTLWIERFDTLQNFEDTAFDIDMDRKNRFAHLMKSSALFFINHMGEHYMQTRTSLALAHRYKLKDAQGNEVPLFECYEVVGNELKLKKEFEGQWDAKKEVEFRMKTNALNKSFHGIYNKIDRSYFQQKAVGRAALMFRKFIRPGWNRRWRNKYYNYELDDVTEGYYQTMRRFLGVLGKDLAQGQLAITAHWNELTDQEKANMMRALAEVGYMTAFALMSQVIVFAAQGVDDDDPEGWALNMAAYEVRRTLGELRFYIPVPGFGSSDFLRILQSPAAAVQNIQQLNNTLNYLFNPFTWGETMQRGQYEGWPKIARYGVDLVPMNRTIRGILTPEDKLKYFTKPIYN